MQVMLGARDGIESILHESTKICVSITEQQGWSLPAHTLQFFFY